MPVADLRSALQPKGQPSLASKARGPVAIVDIGSNSVRLVIYESQSRVAATLQNEKSICAIGRDMVTAGRLHAAGFIRRAEAAWGRPIRILAGEDEARIAAEGVVAGIPDADGLAADLGGGSLDMVSVKNG